MYMYVESKILQNKSAYMYKGTVIKTLVSMFFYVKKIEYQVPMSQLMLSAIIIVSVLTVCPVWSQLSTKHSCLLNTPVVIGDGAPD